MQLIHFYFLAKLIFVAAITTTTTTITTTSLIIIIIILIITTTNYCPVKRIALPTFAFITQNANRRNSSFFFYYLIENKKKTFYIFRKKNSYKNTLTIIWLLLRLLGIGWKHLCNWMQYNKLYRPNLPGFYNLKKKNFFFTFTFYKSKSNPIKLNHFPSHSAHIFVHFKSLKKNSQLGVNNSSFKFLLLLLLVRFKTKLNSTLIRCQSLIKFKKWWSLSFYSVVVVVVVNLLSVRLNLFKFEKKKLFILWFKTI